MIFHLDSGLPKKEVIQLNHESPGLTATEARIIRDQIRKNSMMIDLYLIRLDLLVNKEKYPSSANFLAKIRSQLDLLISENDTFRDVLWTHFQAEEMSRKEDPVFFD